jgi:hypothetical protein
MELHIHTACVKLSDLDDFLSTITGTKANRAFKGIHKSIVTVIISEFSLPLHPTLHFRGATSGNKGKGKGTTP